MHVLLVSCGDPVVEDVVVELTFSGFELLPANGDESSVDMIASEARQDDICLRRGACRGIAEFAAKNKEGLAMDDKLGGPRWGGHDVWRLVSVSLTHTERRRKEQAHEAQRGPQARISPRHSSVIELRT